MTRTTDEAYGAGGNLLLRYTGDSNSRSFIPFNGRLLAEYYCGGMIFDHPDEIGSATTATDCAGNVVQERLYYPFGEFWTGFGGTASAGMHPAFAQLPDYDPETDQYNTANRHYSPSGRWLSPDPGGLKFVHFDDPQTWNMYAYVRNNPMTLTDPSGLGWWKDFWKGLSDATWRPMVTMVEHPIVTADAIGNAVTHPVGTYHALKNGVVTTTQQAIKGNGKAIGLAVGTIGMALIPGAGEAGDVAEGTEDVARAGEAAEAAETAVNTAGHGAVGGGATTAENALTQAEKYLGPGYKEIAPGVFRSADGTRQFRMTAGDLMGAHGDIGPHVNFESIGADGRTITENAHVGITNP